MIDKIWVDVHIKIRLNLLVYQKNNIKATICSWIEKVAWYKSNTEKYSNATLYGFFVIPQSMSLVHLFKMYPTLDIIYV